MWTLTTDSDTETDCEYKENGDATVSGVHMHAESVVTVLFQANVLDYELAGCPVDSSARASGEITGSTLESQLPRLTALGLEPSGAEATANSDIINRALSGTG